MMYKRIVFTLLLAVLCSVSFGAATTTEFNDYKTPDYYESNVRACFRKGEWDKGKRLLDEGMKAFPDVTGLNELAGQYYYVRHRYDDARYYLVLSVRADNQNVRAKQLLVKVEEETRNYSSAICYVNELLEVNPYWKGLWRKKIQLYRRQGNNVEADRLLERLNRIYPNDEGLKNEFNNRLEEKYIHYKREGRRKEAIATLEKLIASVRNNEDLYLQLTNLYLQEGDTEQALVVAGRGVSNIPGSIALVRKKAGILAEEGRYPEAISFVRERMNIRPSGALSALYAELQLDAARAARENDPYVLYGKLYEQRGDQESLDFLLNTSVARGYEEDALHYIAEARRRQGQSKRLLYMEYRIYKRMGNTDKAYALLRSLADTYPGDLDLAEELALFHMQQGTNLMSAGHYSEALPYFRMSVSGTSDPEIRMAARNRLYTCLLELHQYDEAAIVLDTLRTSYLSATAYAEKRADLLNRAGKTEEALATLAQLAKDSLHTESHGLYVTAYEEIAIPFIKDLIASGALKNAHGAVHRLLGVNPSSYYGLRYAITTTELMKHYDEAATHVKSGRSFYPADTFFVVKHASVYERNRQYADALLLLRAPLDSLPGNRSLVGAFSQCSENWALELLRLHRPEAALAVIDTALVFDAYNRSLLYTKGLVYEAQHRYDSAYVYQRYYEPSPLEVAAHRQKMGVLQSQGLKNEVAIEYIQGRYGEEDVLTSVASVAYTRKAVRNSYTGRIDYAGRDGEAEGRSAEYPTRGGVGAQFGFEWAHYYRKPWNTTLHAALSNRYFPKVTVSLRAERELPKEWTINFRGSYRRIEANQKTFRWNPSTYNEETALYGLWEFDQWAESHRNLFNLGAGVGKSLESFYLSARADAFLLDTHCYFNTAFSARYFPLENTRTSINATVGLGTAPEADVIDYAMPGSFEKLNTMVGLGAMYLINKNLSVGLEGTWHTFYNQVNGRRGLQTDYEDYVETSYKNLFNVHVQLHIRF